jgi:hypothetical protein
MTTIPLTIGEFFDEQSDENIVSKTLNPDQKKKLHAVLKDVPNLSLDHVGEEFKDAYKRILDVNMLEIICGAWAKLKELQTYLDQKKHPPGEVSIVPMAEHKIRSKHQPLIEILFGEKKLFELNFEVLMKLKLESFVLKIQDGCIHEIKAGSFIVAGMIKCGNQKIVEKKSRKYNLPSGIVFKECFKIPPITHS